LLSKLKKYAGFADPNYPRPPMKESEEIVAEDRAIFTKGFFGGKAGPLILTNRRLIWCEDYHVPRPIKRISGEINLRDIASVGTNGIVGFVFGGARLKVRVRNGRTRLFWTGRAPLQTWVAALRDTSAKAREVQS
jgi:hypothetical protein